MFSKEFFENPYPVYRMMREAAPVHRLDVYNGHLAACCRFEDCISYLRDPRISSLRPGGSKAMQQFDDDLRAELEEYDRVTGKFMLWMTDERHSVMRKHLYSGFSPAAVDKLRPAIAAQVEKLLDRIGDAREFDVVRALAQPLPSMVVTFVLGIPLEDNELIGTWSDAIIKFAGANTSTSDEARTAVTALSQSTAYFRAKIEERRQNPTEDFIGRMVADCPADFDLDDLAAQCVMIATAGHKTTRDVIAAGVLTLLRHPDALQELRDNPALIRPAVEEILRYESPNQIVPRFAREDMVLHGVEVKRGEVIGIMLASANRDRRCFEDPEWFDIKRRDNTHIAFGGGPHACIGSYLARVDIQIAILGVVQRFPKLQLADAKIDWEPNFAFRGLNSLLVAAR